MPEVEDAQELDFLPLGEPAPENNDTGDNNQTSNDTDDTGDDTNDTDTDVDNDQDDQKGQNNDQGDQDDSQNNTDDNDTESKGDEGGDDSDPDSDGDDEPSIYQSMIDSAGVEFDQETRDEILAAEQDTEGFNKVSSIIAEKKAEARLSALLEANPHTARMLEYESAGGDPEKYINTYFPQTDYNEVEITEDDLDTQKAVVKQNLIEQGFEQDDAEAQVEELETAGILKTNAERSLKALKKRQQERVAAFEKEQKELVQQRQQQQQEQYEKTVEAIDNGDIEGIKIPDKQKDKFKEYIFKPVNEQGMTQAQLDSQNLELNQRLLIAYLNYSGYNLDEFVKKQAKSSSNKNIKNAITKSNNKENLKGKDGGDKKPSKGNVDDIVSPFI